MDEAISKGVATASRWDGLSERTRQRDFEMLRKLGYSVFYDHADHCFSYNEDDFDLGWVDAPDQIDDDFLDGTW